jgi:FtsP/CotA-like multicopper oxidase with cupredoxin domain
MWQRLVFVLWAAANAAGQTAGGTDPATNSPGYPVVEVPAGARLEDLPLTQLWNDGSNVLNLDFTPATLVLEVDGNVLFRANVPVYLDLDDDKTGGVHAVGPLLFLKRGQEYTVTIKNSLPAPNSNAAGANETLQHALDITNFHVHGMHEWGGVPVQSLSAAEPSNYLGGDNILLRVKQGETFTWNGKLSEDHLPGNGWYHPHNHGSTSMQSIGGQGPIVVDDDLEAWLMDDNGCADIRAALTNMPTRNVFMSTYNFEQEAPAPGDSLWYDANYQEVSTAGGSTICCSDDKNSPNALLGNETNANLIIVNGGWQPIIDMKDGQWQRWRLTLAGYTGSVLLSVLDADTQEVTEDCELMLLSKDGVYPMEIPRTVGYGFLTSGARAEVIVRCSGAPGKAFDLVSRNSTEAVSETIGAEIPASKIIPQRIAGIVVEESEGKDDALVSKQCTPLRPAYAADLRNENLVRHNALRALILDPVPNFDRNPLGCTMGGMEFAYPDPAPFVMRIGSVTQWVNMGGLLAHPLHVHINPFQIVDLPKALPGAAGSTNGTYAGDWFEVGDYHDTLLIPQGTSKTQLRFQPGPYSGFSVTHCHFLNHEDSGCMRVINWLCPDGYEVSERGECSAEMPVPGTFKG